MSRNGLGLRDKMSRLEGGPSTYCIGVSWLSLMAVGFRSMTKLNANCTVQKLQTSESTYEVAGSPERFGTSDYRLSPTRPHHSYSPAASLAAGPSTYRVQVGHVSFFLVLWNSLPVGLRRINLSIGQFRSALKTHLFN